MPCLHLDEGMFVGSSKNNLYRRRDKACLVSLFDEGMFVGSSKNQIYSYRETIL